ncbi:MAG: hypothetical protein J2P22_00255 [Nocardioides sp.]|nr:hypothetical protein [Nocardioides sp.]
MSATMVLADHARKRLQGLDGVRLMGAKVVDEGYAFEVDPLVLTIDVRALGITGYQAAELARDRYQVDFGSADTFRISACLTHADDHASVDRLLTVLEQLCGDAPEIASSGPVDLPPSEGLEPEIAMRPRDAFFADIEQVPAAQTAGRVVAEMVTPYPPGVPVLAPGEVITEEAIDYLRSGLAAGMLIPDAADPTLETLRVVRRDPVSKNPRGATAAAR